MLCVKLAISFIYEQLWRLFQAPSHHWTLINKETFLIKLKNEEVSLLWYKDPSYQGVRLIQIGVVACRISCFWDQPSNGAQAFFLKSFFNCSWCGSCSIGQKIIEACMSHAGELEGLLRCKIKIKTNAFWLAQTIAVAPNNGGHSRKKSYSDCPRISRTQGCGSNRTYSLGSEPMLNKSIARLARSSALIEGLPTAIPIACYPELFQWCHHVISR